MAQICKSFGARRVFFSAAAAIVSMTALSTQAFAEPEDHYWQPVNCTLGSATFITLPADQHEFGFKETEKAIQLSVRSTSDRAVAVAVVPGGGVRGADDFRSIGVYVRGNAASLISVRFCFIGDHGDGSSFTVTKSLNGFSKLGPKTPDGWQLYSKTSRDFSGLDVRSAVLERVAFSLGQAPPDTTAVVGNAGIQTATFLLQPHQESMVAVPCSFSTQCP